MEYTAIQKSFDAGMPKGLRWFTKAHYLDKLSDPAIETLIKNTQSLPGAYSVAYLEPMGGEANRVDPAATAFPHRNAAYSLHIFPGWDDPKKDEENIKWAKEFYQAMQKKRPVACMSTY
jgi:hypothetical protein